ncbi:hypothetical protein MNBD_DELTA01-1345 [hydrothermal vent metagenome]|uniref:ATP synthase protein I n=1 Tax=hydrothermal vent metagenome TaxID=652676 RepID=A0A3B0QXS9_9ZZZZ
MDSKTIDTSVARIDTATILPQLDNTGFKVAVVNAVMLVAGIALCIAIKKDNAALPFALGVIAGVFNLYMYLKILKKGLTKPIDNMASFIMSRYYVKFFIIMATLIILIMLAKMNPLPLLAGFAATIMTTIIAMVFISRKEFE